MTDPAAHKVSQEDRTKIAALENAIAHAEKEIAQILAAYFGAKKGTLVHDHAPHEPRTEVVRLVTEKKLIAVVDYGNGYGCYYDPPGICERC
jgi:hypothetical protein